MADLVSIFGGPFTLRARQEAAPLEHQIADAMQAMGITPPHPIQIDGKLHRFRAGTKGQGGHGGKTGWYVIYPDGIPAGKFGCWRAGIECNWRAEIGRTLTQIEETLHTTRLAEAKSIRDAELARSHGVAANTVEKIWVDADLSMAATNCARWRIKSVPVWLREKGCMSPGELWRRAH
jgi:phage/plasmid primase-like uncharacterized protein